jgi:hypothetical protein
MAQKITDRQKESIARRMGYDGPMEMFEQFIKSNPALERKYGAVVQRFMARGGAVMRAKSGGAVTKKKLKMQEGGAVQTSTTDLTSAVWGPDGKMYDSAASAQAAGVTNISATPVPVLATTATPTATTIDTGTGQAGTASTATLSTAQAAPDVAAPTPTTAPTYTAGQATPAIEQTLAGVAPAQGTVSQQAQVQAATMEPTSTAVGGVQAAQATPAEYTQVQAPTQRTAQAGEMVAGTTVDMGRVEAALQQGQAAQGVVTPEMTIQGQLNQMLANFDAGNPPPWAAASLRAATAQLAARGLGASSLAGQAIIQATLEAATPIAAADAATFERMGLQNLSNKQQMAVLNAQQRAAFLGQEFDQGFQTRVLNAAKLSDIANMNFNADVQIALENARMAQTVNLTNLSNRQAVVMATAAQIASLETQNLSNQQQAAVQNAQAFLQMDLTNLGYEQQTSLFKAQEITQALLSDTAARNAALQFNATSQLQSDQFNANLATQVSQFNVSQRNAMEQFNVSSANAFEQFNASQKNAMDQFNAQNALVVAQANAQLLTQVSLADTAAINAANQFNAQTALGISTTQYNAQVQVLRDNMQYAWQTGENALSREMELAKTRLSTEAQRYGADRSVDAAMYEALGTMGAKILATGSSPGTVIGDLKSALTAGTKAVMSFITGATSDLYKPIPNQAEFGEPGHGWSYYESNDNSGDTVVISPNKEYYYNGELVWYPNMPTSGSDFGFSTDFGE